MFGGFTYLRGHGIILNDTWTFSAGNWTHVTTRVSPIGTESFGLAYDPVVSRVVLFGGEVGISKAPFSNQTWFYSKGVWTSVNLTYAPIVRSAPAMCFDALDGYILLFGGDSYTGELSDTWYLT